MKRKILTLVFLLFSVINIKAILGGAAIRELMIENRESALLKQDSTMAEKGNVNCQLSCALKYWKQNKYTISRRFINMAIAQGNYTAMTYLAEMDYYGYGIDKPDYVSAKRNAINALNAGNKDSYYILGKMYYDGIVFDKNYDKAFWYFSNLPLSSCNINLAYYYMSKCYRYGKGIKNVNMKLSNEYLKKCKEYMYFPYDYYNEECWNKWYNKKSAIDVERNKIKRIYEIMNAEV